jgi:endonuclease/exonuclease/phosphatase family metal-dependent hydrolase
MSSDPRAWLDGLRAAATLDELRGSSFYAAHGAKIDALLASAEIVRLERAEPRVGAFVRVAQWNIEKGRRFDAILATLHSDPVLRRADVLILNEADCGMNRSGNRHVALDLARELGTHMAYGPAHIELTRGTGDDLDVEGENHESLQGNAVLSRHPILDARTVALPVCFEPYHFHEKRYGRRTCLWASLRIGGRPWWVGSVHLEVRDTPRCRLHQVEHLLARLPGPDDAPCVIGGDFNSNGFSRGTLLRTVASAWRLTSRPPAAVKEELRHPERGSEPLFEAFRRRGFSWEGLNGGAATASSAIGGLEDAALVLAWLRAWIERRLEPYEGRLDLRLDWLVGRGVRPLEPGAVEDAATGERSRGAGCIETPHWGPERVSDHVPIHADLAL